MVDFDMVLDAVKVEPNKYTREDVIEHVTPYIRQLLAYPLKDILHPDAIEALNKRMKPGMEEYLGDIRLQEVISSHSVHQHDASSKPARKRAPRIDYNHTAELLIQFLLEHPRSSFRVIREHLASNGVEITQSQWQRLRQLVFAKPFEYAGKKYLLRHEGEKSKTRWWVQEVA